MAVDLIGEGKNAPVQTDSVCCCRDLGVRLASGGVAIYCRARCLTTYRYGAGVAAWRQESAPRRLLQDLPQGQGLWQQLHQQIQDLYQRTGLRLRRVGHALRGSGRDDGRTMRPAALFLRESAVRCRKPFAHFFPQRHNVSQIHGPVGGGSPMLTGRARQGNILR